MVSWKVTLLPLTVMPERLQVFGVLNLCDLFFRLFAFRLLAFARRRWYRRLGRRLLSAFAGCGWLRRGGRRVACVVAEDRLADLDLVAGLHLDLFDGAGNRRRDLDRRLVGFELDDRLIFRDGVARLDQDAEDVAGFDLLAKLGEGEISRHEAKSPRAGNIPPPRTLRTRRSNLVRERTDPLCPPCPLR